ncbi:MAG: hypothetical protein AAF624_05835 [Bacteroidota bacterium]
MSRVVLVLGLLSLLALPATAQQDAPAQQNRIGIGVSIEPLTNFVLIDNEIFSSVELFAPSLYVPITLGQFRLEPEFSFVRDAVSDDDDTSSNSRLRVGTGLFYYNLIDKANALYVGTRVGLARTAFTNPFSDDTESRTDFFIAPALGGEHYFGALSLGVEGQLQYTRIGSFDEDSDLSRSQLLVRALFFARFHF